MGFSQCWIVVLVQLKIGLLLLLFLLLYWTGWRGVENLVFFFELWASTVHLGCRGHSCASAARSSRTVILVPTVISATTSIIASWTSTASASSAATWSVFFCLFIKSSSFLYFLLTLDLALFVLFNFVLEFFNLFKQLAFSVFFVPGVFLANLIYLFV